jgi:hypothetical protein
VRHVVTTPLTVQLVVIKEGPLDADLDMFITFHFCDRKERIQELPVAQVEIMLYTASSTTIQHGLNHRFDNNIYTITRDHLKP